MKKIAISVLIIISMFSFCSSLLAAVGCTLNDPDRDVKRLFPKSTGYKTSFISIKEKGGQELKLAIEEKLGDKLEPIYEAVDVPYAYYDILKGKELIGRVHGINQKGTYGGMQLILATDTNGVIKAFYFQKLSSPEAKLFRSESFISQFVGLKLDDFYSESLDIKDPSKKEDADFKAAIRGIKKNLILLEEFKIKEGERE